MFGHNHRAKKKTLKGTSIWKEHAGESNFKEAKVADVKSRVH